MKDVFSLLTKWEQCKTTCEELNNTKKHFRVFLLTLKSWMKMETHSWCCLCWLLQGSWRWRQTESLHFVLTGQRETQGLPKHIHSCSSNKEPRITQRHSYLQLEDFDSVVCWREKKGFGVIWYSFDIIVPLILNKIKRGYSKKNKKNTVPSH